MSRRCRWIHRAGGFPSPRGDKLCPVSENYVCFRNWFPSPRGDKLCPEVWPPVLLPASLFPSPRGDKLCPAAHRAVKPCAAFPSPRGDKLCHKGTDKPLGRLGFRPLAGISCVLDVVHVAVHVLGFRPLAGISCVWPRNGRRRAGTSFRPLAGISCVCKTAQLEPVGLGLVLTGSLYHTPLQPASGSWK